MIQFNLNYKEKFANKSWGFIFDKYNFFMLLLKSYRIKD